MKAKQFRARCKALGVSYEDTGVALHITAPDGMVFAIGSGVHQLSISYDCPPGAWRINDVYGAMVEDMEMGLEYCEDPECDWCLGY